MSIVSNETVVSRYANFILVSFNLLLANAYLLMCKVHLQSTKTIIYQTRERPSIIFLENMFLGFR